MKTFVIHIFISAALLFTLVSCNAQPTAPGEKPVFTLSLSQDDITCTEAWLRVDSGNMPLPAKMRLTLNDSCRRTITLTRKDTTIYIDSLLPNKAYTLQAAIPLGTTSEAKSSIQLKTMDTTSHSFAWQTFTFHGECQDVSIENDTSIWVAGIFTQGNAAHWNGKEWKFFAYPFYDFCGQSTTYSYETTSVHAFGNGYVMLFCGSQVAYIKNEQHILTDCIPVSVRRVWAASPSDVYVAGPMGRAGHYDGTYWISIETGTAMELQDIWGNVDPASGKRRVFCVASDKYENVDKKVFELSGNLSSEIESNNLPWSLSSIWFSNPNAVYIAGDGIFRANLNESSVLWKNLTKGITIYYSHGIRGDAYNNIFLAGSFGDIAHYNGITWKDYLASELQMFNGNFYSLSVGGGMVCAVGGSVGIEGDIAVIVIGKRN